MNLYLLHNDPRNTVINSPDGFPLYHVDTPFKLFGSVTNVLKVQPPQNGGGKDNIATINSGWGSTVSVWGRDVTPRRGMLSRSEEFIATDGRSYKWTSDWKDFRLTRNDGSHAPVASYDHGSLGILSRSKPATLSVTPEGIPILDDIVATWVYVEQKRRRRRRAAAAAAAS